jgi:DNA-binding FadR family transcriptional regulator
LVKRSIQKGTKAPADPRGSPERLADDLLVRILRGDYPPGTRLPPERQLAIELGVDRTTLRMAVKQLGRMNLITAHHGSGIEVNDYRERGGLDVLAALFSFEELPLEGSFIVEALDFWLEMFSLTAAKAVVRMSLEDLGKIERLIDAAESAVGDREALALALTALNDEMARLSGSVLFRMLNTSIRASVRRVILLLWETGEIAPSLSAMKGALRVAAFTRPGEENVRRGVHALLRGLTARLRERLMFGGLSVNVQPKAEATPKPKAAARKSPRKGRKR